MAKKQFYSLATLILVGLWLSRPRESSAQQDYFHVAAGTPTYISSATTTVVKGTAGTLRRIIIGTPIAAATVDVYNIASAGCTGTPASGLISSNLLPVTLTNPPILEFNATMSLGICVVTSGATKLTVITE